MSQVIARHSLEGVRNAEISTHQFVTQDGLDLSLLRFCRGPSKDVVLLIHGCTTSTDMFIQPEHYNLVSYLLDHGFPDVWSLDYRMSNRHDYNLQPNGFSMDDVALYDHPAAIRKLREVVGEDAAIHVVSHCLGAMTFGMALFGRTVTGIRSCIANSVFLTPKIPLWCKIKGVFFPFLIEKVLRLPYVDPLWAVRPGWGWGKLLGKIMSLLHRECDVPACHMLSEMWGAGWPAVWRHENMDEITHRRAGDLFGGVRMNYHRHAMKMANRLRTVRMSPKDSSYTALPYDYLSNAQAVETPCLLVTGDTNRVFLNSNQKCHEEFQQRVPGRHQLHIFGNYGHQDIFMGKNVAQDIFPTLLAFLNQHRAARAG
jgi:lysosomal acid lipase/cholesteryl ester hydrolase